MNVDSYKIIVSISHHRISYEYWQSDGENKLVPIPSGNWPAPLAFYCSERGIVIGEDAVRAAHSGTMNAFDSYFERSAEGGAYTICGQNRPFSNLLLDASESIFRDFYVQVLFSRFGSLSDNRANMPLIFVCESDVKPNERALLKGLFKDSGYNRVKVVDYNSYINKYIHESLSKEYACDKVVVAWTESNDLTFSIFGVKNDCEPIVKSYENLGIDPRMAYVENLIWDRVMGQNPWLQRADEQDAISKAASDFLNSTDPLVNKTILLSDGNYYHYSLNRNTIDNIQGTDGMSVKGSLAQFLTENGITNRARVLLLLRGNVVGNTYFEQNLSPGFCKTIKTGKTLRDKIMNLIITEEDTLKVEPAVPSKSNGIKDNSHVGLGGGSLPDTDKPKREIAKKWREKKAEAEGKYGVGKYELAIQILEDFLSECQAISGVDDIISEINKLTGKFRDNTISVKDLERRWRETKAKAKAKVRSGNEIEARSILQEFLEEVRKLPGTDAIVASIKKELSLIANDKAQSEPKEIERPHTKPEQKKAVPPSDKNEGETYIAQGKLKEARDWYRGQNDMTTTKLLTDIMRQKKSIDSRKTSVDEYRKSKNQEQIARIVTEIEEYINLCQKVGVDISEYKKILTEYRKIIKSIKQEKQ